MDFHNNEDEQQYAAHLISSDFPLNVCGLCGIMGKVFIKLRGNDELISKINNYLPFIDVQNLFSDRICYTCSSQINSWNGFYLNCSFLNSKLDKEPIIPEIGNFCSNKKQKSMSNMVYACPVDQINDSYNRLQKNPCTENVARTMDILTDCLKSLTSQLKTLRSSSASLCEEIVPDGSNEDDESNPEISGLIKPIDVIEVDLSESDAALDTKNKPVPKSLNEKLKRIQQVQSESQHGTLFYDDHGYTYRINKKQPGRVYVRCSNLKCPVRGSVHGNSFRSNKYEHTHPPQRIIQFPDPLRSFRNSKSLLSNKERVKEFETYS